MPFGFTTGKNRTYIYLSIYLKNIYTQHFVNVFYVLLKVCGSKERINKTKLY